MKKMNEEITKYFLIGVLISVLRLIMNGYHKKLIERLENMWGIGVVTKPDGYLLTREEESYFIPYNTFNLYTVMEVVGKLLKIKESQ